MRNIYLLLTILFTTILLILFVFYNRYSNYYEDEKINAYISKNIEILNENLSFEKRYALSLSLFVAKNENIKKALRENNQKLALSEIEKFLKDMKHSTGISNIDIQIHTKDLRAFARNWDKSDYFGAKLGSFRKGLVRVKKSKKPFVSIELGKRLNIKAISPILDKEGNFIGSIEVIMDFQNIQKRLRKFDLKMLPLLNERFIGIAVDLKNHKKIEGYYVVEKNYPKELYEKLKKNSYIFKDKKFFHIVDNKIIVLVPMLSVGIEDVGVIALCMDAKYSEMDVSKRDIDFENESYKFNKNYREVIIR